MRICRFRIADTEHYGVVEGNPGEEKITPLTGDLFNDSWQRTDQVYAMAEVTLLAPVVPGKIMGVVLNYQTEGRRLPEGDSWRTAIVFKPPSAVLDPGKTVYHPGPPWQVHHEAELAVVIGKPCRDLAVEQCAEVVLGYTCANDVTAYASQPTSSWSKHFDTFCPLGPWLVTDLDPAALDITCTVNDELRQSGSTRQMIRTVPEVVSQISQHMTLLPGDVILTGTPAGSGPVNPGDHVSVSISGIGTLAHTVE